MPTFKELATSAKEKINSLLTKETPKETLDLITDVNKIIDSMQESNDKTAKEKADIQELYIGQVKGSGSTDKPKEDTPKAPRSLEEIADDILKGGE